MLDERRPSFAHDFPRTPELSGLVEDFARGDYARVRLAGSQLARSSPDEEVRRAAKELVDRTKPDPLAVALLALTALLLVTLATFWILNGHAPPVTVAPVSP